MGVKAIVDIPIEMQQFQIFATRKKWSTLCRWKWILSIVGRSPAYYDEIKLVTREGERACGGLGRV